MRVPVSWLREYVRLPADLPVHDLAARLTGLGLKLEALEFPGADVTGPLVVGRVVDYVTEEHKNGKTIRWCQVDVGEHNADGEPRGIVCGAHNFRAGDLVVVALPGAKLPGGFAISARKTYGHVSDGMICSARELGLGDDHTGIIVCEPGFGEPGDDAVPRLHLRDDVIEFEINPDRAYALSVRGVAREAAIAYDAEFTDPALAPVADEDEPSYPVNVEDPTGCPVFVTRTVTGFDPAAPSPRWLARRVQLAGMRPISLAVDVTNYAMLELGQPIHAYDRAALTGPIGVRRARAGEHLTTLDGVDRALDPEDLLITDDSGPIGLAGVMGGATTEIGGRTTDIVIEAASFDPVSIGRTARRHRLPSEASRRFERGVDPALPQRAADRVAELLTAHGGGKVEPGRTVVGRTPAREPIALPAGLSATVTGMPIEADTVVASLHRVGCEVVRDTNEVGGGAADVLTVTPPTWRHDLTDPNDLVEEVARQVGYERVPSVLPTAPAGRGLTTTQRLRRRVGYTLAGAGLVEVLCYPFVGPDDWAALGLADDDPRRRTLRIANPISEQEPELRTTLLPGLLRTLARNVGRGQTDAALFESGVVFRPGERPPAAPILGVSRRPTDQELATLEAAVPDQPRHLALLLTGDREPAGWWGAGRPASWADAVGAVRRLAQVLGVEVTTRSVQRAPWHPGRCGEVRVGETVVGHAGELHPRVCQAYGVPPRTAAAEVDLDLLLASAAAIVTAPVFSTYPVAKEDVALLVDESVPAAEVEAALRAGAGDLLERIRLFDVYTGDQVPAGKKSLAFALRFRAPGRTLTEAETGAARDAAVAAAAQRVGAEQRA
ncbi:MAG: phenylalanine--tRNA ligase subunit beta [Actinomycetota bacterium]|nr:phenylalanine--tRNA ligase subunit beta [Actinomycetota bacterium]